ncbi:MAG TPA: hypothetical protein ENJ43_02125 [Gammaproteobacteria bacterium]|nr:hypothetical protein [Gammaproteobacteria bacterium]
MLSWTVTLGWTAFIVYLLLKHGNAPSAPFLASFFRMDFSREELREAVGHFAMFGTLTLLWWSTLIQHYSVRYALLATVMIAVLLGTGTELGQYFVARSSVILDLVANFAGITVTMLCLQFIVSRQGGLVAARDSGRYLR